MSKYHFTESEIYLPGTGAGVHASPQPTRNSEALKEGPSGLNAYIEASILCVQRADSSKLRQIILQGLERT